MNAWIWDDSGSFGIPRIGVEAVADQWDTHDIQVNLATAQRYGLRPGDVRREATTLTSGLIVGNLYEQSKIFDVVVWGAQRTRSDLTQLGNLLIDTPSGGQVPLRDVATVKVHAEPAAITPESEDPVTHALDLQRERCVLFAACTRARDHLYVSATGAPSTFLPDDAVVRPDLGGQPAGG